MAWLGILSNGLWILAVALLIALWGFASWEQVSTGRKFRQILASSPWNGALHLAAAAFCLGMAGVFQALLARVFWSMWTVFFIIQTRVDVRMANK